ncbi:MAG: ABC transporter permease [Oscillospiraceae bacterium]|jgi:ABC-2 type transport system permease protein|nr:ABC transporter permease [Oscillospiraceae bacterium]
MSVLKKAKKTLFLLLFLLAVLSGLAFSSRDSLRNITQNHEQKTVTASEVTLSGWSENNGKLVSVENASVTVEGVNCYVRNINIAGKFDVRDGYVRVRYTKAADEAFNDENMLIRPVKYMTGGGYITVLEDVYSLSVTLFDGGEGSLQISGVQVNPRGITISISDLLLWWSLLTVFAAAAALIFILGRLRAYLEVFRRFSALLRDLVSRDLKVKYRRSLLGFVWSVLNPLLMMTVMTVVFSQLFRFDIKNFPVYYLTGVLIFNFVVEATTSSLGSVLGAAPLIKKVYIPKYIFPLEKCLFAFVNMLFSMAAVVIVFTVLRIELHWTIFLFPLPMLYAFVFALGLGLVLSAFNVMFRDIEHLYGVWVTAWLYLTPVIYPLDLLSRLFRDIMQLNPLYHYVDYIRNVMIYGKVPSVRENLICLGFSLAFLLVGVLTFKRQQDKFILHI